jgi:hypothetical protein
MRKLCHAILVLGLLLSPAARADDVAVSIGIGIGTPHASIGIHVGDYPRLVAVPGYPVYYAPRLQANFFFYDGLYWVFEDDDWYASYWYNGPWWYVRPLAVPVYLLRVPVRYYHHPPPYFRGWRRDAPPRWGDYWGHEWEQQRSGWDRWNHRAVPPLAPLPAYQRRYSGDDYPRQVERQRALQQQHYRYQPRDPAVRQGYQQRYQDRYQERRPPPPPQSGQYPREQRDFREQRAPQSQRPQGREDRPQGRDASPHGRDGRDQERGQGRGNGH